MTQTMVEGTDGTTAEVSELGPNVELNLTSDASKYNDGSCVSITLTPRQARALARQLLEQADSAEYGDEG